VNGSIKIEALKRSDVRREVLVPDQSGGRTMPTLAPRLAEVAQLVADPGRASRWPTACGIAGFWCSAPMDPQAAARPIGRDHREGIAAFRELFGVGI
jgi:hypothetical protein